MPTCTFHSGHLATIDGSSQHVSASCSVLFSQHHCFCVTLHQVSCRESGSATKLLCILDRRGGLVYLTSGMVQVSQ